MGHDERKTFRGFAVFRRGLLYSGARQRRKLFTEKRFALVETLIRQRGVRIL